MSHHVEAFVGGRPILELIQRQFQVSEVVDLDQRLALLPMLDELYDAIPNESDGEPEAHFKFLAPKIMELLKQTSTSGIIGYFETDYFGGNGTQGAVLAKQGRIIFGPSRSDDSINQILRGLGASVFRAHDEFDAVGLGRYRENEDWIKRPTVTPKREDATLTGSLISWIHGLGKK